LSVDGAATDGERTITDTSGDWHLETFDVPTPNTVNDLEVTFDDHDATSTVEVIASGNAGGEVIELSVDGETVASWILDEDLAGYYGTSPNLKTYTYVCPSVITTEDIRVTFTNDGGTGAIDKNVRLDAVVVDGVRYEAEADTVSSTGVFVSGVGCTGGYWESEQMRCGGYTDSTTDNPALADFGPTTSTVEVTAVGHAGGELIELWIDGF
jgi:hypothetical protein